MMRFGAIWCDLMRFQFVIFRKNIFFGETNAINNVRISVLNTRQTGNHWVNGIWFIISWTRLPATKKGWLFMLPFRDQRSFPSGGEQSCGDHPAISTWSWIVHPFRPTPLFGLLKAGWLVSTRLALRWVWGAKQWRFLVIDNLLLLSW